jgi:hypothetical protein
LSDKAKNVKFHVLTAASVKTAVVYFNTARIPEKPKVAVEWLKHLLPSPLYSGIPWFKSLPGDQVS